MSTVFKIRRKSDGLFSSGGVDPHFNKIGKAWATESTMRSHLTLVGDGPLQGYAYGITDEKLRDNRKKNLLDRYRDCEIVKFEVVESFTTDVETYEDVRNKDVIHGG